MKTIQRKHWSYEETSESQQLRIFDITGLKKHGTAYMGPSPTELYEANGWISAHISEKTANHLRDSGLGRIILNSHTALLLFFENVLTVKVLAEAQEDDDSIVARMFSVPVVIKDNPEFAIAYYDPNGSLLTA